MYVRSATSIIFGNYRFADYEDPLGRAQIPAASTQQLPAKWVYDRWKQSLQSKLSPQTGKKLTPKQVSTLQKKIQDYDKRIQAGEKPTQTTTPIQQSAPAQPAQTTQPETGTYELAGEAQGVTQQPQGRVYNLETTTPKHLDRMEQILNQPNPTKPDGTAWTPQELANFQATIDRRNAVQDEANAVQTSQVEAEAQARELQEANEAAGGVRIEDIERERVQAAPPTEVAVPEQTQDTDPATPGFQPPEWATPQMQQAMQQAYGQNQRNQQFDDWASGDHGFTEEQVEQFRGMQNPPQQQRQIQPWGQPQGQMQPWQGQPQQQQQNSFWGDVGRGAASGATIGGGVGLLGGGVGAPASAAAGGLIGGAIGGAKNLWNRGKNLYNQWGQFRNWQQNQPQGNWQQQNQYARAASGNPYLTAYGGSAQRLILGSNEDDLMDLFLETLNDDDKSIFMDYMHGDFEGGPSEIQATAKKTHLNVMFPKLPILTAELASAHVLIQKY